MKKLLVGIRWATVALLTAGWFAACADNGPGEGVVSSGDSPAPRPTGTTEPGPGPGPGPGPSGDGSVVLLPDGAPAPTLDRDLSTQGPPAEQIDGVLCAKDNSAYNLMELVPSTAPLAVQTAWTQAKAITGTHPAAVLRISGAVAGAPPTVTLGGVHLVSPSEYEFDPGAATTPLLPVDLTAGDPGRFAYQGAANFVFAFSRNSLNGFQPDHAVIDGKVDQNCDVFTGSVTLRIPSANAASPIGSTTVGAAFGAPNLDFDGDGNMDGWTFTLTGVATTTSMRFE